MKNKRFFISIDDLYIDFRRARSKMNEKNWEDILISFLDKLDRISGIINNERVVIGWLAGLCEHAYYLVAYDKEVDKYLYFKKRFSRIFSLKKLPNFLKNRGDIICGKRQPSFVQTIIPTLKRFQVIECLPRVFNVMIESIIIGGSMSYVPFFGIREEKKTKDFSDIDALIIIDKNFFRKTAWKNFMDSNIFPLSEKKIFLDRLKKFEKLLKNNKADIFSQRFSVIGSLFTISCHFVTSYTFKRMVFTDLRKSLQLRNDFQYLMRDFRANPFTHPCHARHTFNGERIESIIEGKKIGKAGFISNVPGYIIFEKKFFPGVYHTIISPAFLVFYDRTGKTTELVGKFRDILYHEVDNVRKEFPFATYDKAHNRYDIFSPGRYDEGHNSYVSERKIKKYLLPPNFSIIEIESSPLIDEVIYSGKVFIEKNDDTRNEVKEYLRKWKDKTLKRADCRIKDFISKNDFHATASLSKDKVYSWHTVVIIERCNQIIKPLAYPYRKGRSGSIVRNEVFTQIITPADIMRLEAYEKLVQKFGKVYVSSIKDDVAIDSHLPIGYGVVVQKLS